MAKEVILVFPWSIPSGGEVRKAVTEALVIASVRCDINMNQTQHNQAYLVIVSRLYAFSVWIVMFIS